MIQQTIHNANSGYLSWCRHWSPQYSNLQWKSTSPRGKETHPSHNEPAKVIWDRWPDNRPLENQRKREVIFRKLGRNTTFHWPKRVPNSIGENIIRTIRSRALGYPVVNSRVDRMQLHTSAALKIVIIQLRHWGSSCWLTRRLNANASVSGQ